MNCDTCGAPVDVDPDGDPHYRTRSSIAAANLATVVMIELARLRRIAERAGAWKTRDGIWVFRDDPVYAIISERDGPKIIEIPASLIDCGEGNRKFWYGARPEMELIARKELGAKT